MEAENRSAFLVRVVQETLDSIVSPNVRDALMQEALALAGEKELPAQQSRFPKFLDGPLKKALMRALGPELGQSVVSELERLTLLDTSEPIRESNPKPTARARRHPLATLPAGVAVSEATAPTASAAESGPAGSGPGRAGPVASRPAASAPAVSRSAGAVASGAVASEAVASGAVASGAVASEAVSSRAVAAGARHALSKPDVSGPAVSPPMASPPPTLPPPASPRDELARAATAPTWPVRAPDAKPAEFRSPVSADYPAGTAGFLGLGEAQVASRRLPMAFLVTRSSDLVQRFNDWLDPRVIALRVSRLIDLVLNIQDAGPRRIVIVLDAAEPPVRVESLAAVYEELPDNVRVVLWGYPTDLPAFVGELFPRSREWLICSEPAPLSEAVERCIGGGAVKVPPSA